MRLELEAFADRTLVEGTDIRVGPQLAQNFSLALHELATNAAKYGALSDRNGKVGIYWTMVSEGESNRLKLKWQERRGPSDHSADPPRVRHRVAQGSISGCPL
jgi:two-component sensor histidine kinase